MVYYTKKKMKKRSEKDKKYFSDYLMALTKQIKRLKCTVLRGLLNVVKFLILIVLVLEL